MKRFRYKPIEWQDEIRLLRIIDIDENNDENYDDTDDENDNVNDEDSTHRPFQPRLPSDLWPSTEGSVHSATSLDQNEDEQDGVHLKVLKVELVHMSSADPKSYKALSYAWGDPTMTKGIIINNRKSRITASLHSALFNLHVGVLAGNEESTYIWADAICINQTDNDEKMHQVQQMKRIYENASEVIVWLGPGSSWRYQGCEELERVGKACQLEYAWGADPHAVKATEQGKLLELLSEGWDLKKERALNKVFECSWFGRAWVQQEVAVASSVTVVCGRRWISFELLAAAVNAYALLSGAQTYQMNSRSTWFGAGYFLLREAIRYNTIRNGSPLNTERLETVQCTLANRFQYRDPERKKLIDHLLDNDLGGFGQLHASDCRDLVYAFLGLSIDAEQLNIEPRYDIEWPTVFTDVTYKLIQKEGPGILTLCGGRNQILMKKADKFLPSWALNIKSLPIHSSINKRIWQMSLFNASLNSDFVCERNDSRHLPTLEIDGVVVDTIKEVEGRIWWKGKITMIPLLNQIKKFLVKSNMYTARDKTTALRRIPIHDMEGRGKELYTQITSTSSPGQRQYRSALLKLEKGSIFRKYSKNTLEDLARGMTSPFLSSNGYVGLCPRGAEPGDMICIIYGLGVPLLLRNNGAGGEDTCVLVGEMYVHGIMDGEFMQTKRERRKFRLV